MVRLFKRADAKGNGRIGARDFRGVLNEESIKVWLESMDLDASDSDLLFALIKKEGQRTISAEELCHGVARLKGTARSVDVQMVLRALKEQWAPEMFELEQEKLYDVNKFASATSMDSAESMDG
jgi:hypothetical protein